MKFNSNLSLPQNPAQRCAPPRRSFGQFAKSPAPAWWLARQDRPVRIPPPIIVARPILRGEKSYLRALRAAEMAVWNANVKLAPSLA